MMNIKILMPCKIMRSHLKLRSSKIKLMEVIKYINYKHILKKNVYEIPIIN